MEPLLPTGPLRLRVERLWNGAPAPGGVGAEVVLEPHRQGLRVRARARLPGPARVPDAPRGARVERLWEFDVVECFLVGAGGRYLEIELGAGGHWLALSFSAPRVRADAHADLGLVPAFRGGPEGFESTAVLPLALLPPGLDRANAFAILGGSFLAHHPVPGASPDFHQPGSFPPL